MSTVPAHSFLDPTRRKSMAAARSIPGVCAVFVSRRSLLMTRTPSLRQSGGTPAIASPVLERISAGNDERGRIEADVRRALDPVGISREAGSHLRPAIRGMQVPAVVDPVGQSGRYGRAPHG